LDFDLERVYLVLEEVTIDDDSQGSSSGNGNGVIEFGETIELTTVVRNIGHVDAFDVMGEITTESAFVDILVGLTDFGNIPAGEPATGAEPFVFDVAADVPNGEMLGFVFGVSEEPGAFALEFETRAPTYFVSIIGIDDSVGGNANGIPDPGETVELTLTIENCGGSDSPDMQAVLRTASDYFVPDAQSHPLGVLGIGEEVTVGEFVVGISPSCPPVYANYLLLALSGPDDYELSPPLVFCAGQAFADDLEMDAVSWMHRADVGGWNDEWHREVHRNHTPGGTTSWKCGGPGDWDYGNLLHAVLETAEFYLPPESRVEFWHWIDAEISQAHTGYCYDGGLLEISTDGGDTWQMVTPEGDYPYHIRAGTIPGPFPAETPVWSGQHDWSEAGLDLSAYDGLVKLRWVFGTDGADTREGWYIDDVRVGMGWPSPVGPDAPPRVLRPVLFPASPNPTLPGGTAGGASPGVVLRFALPQTGNGALTLFDTSGRLVRVLASGVLTAGEHRLMWDGRDGAGLPVGTGNYYLRLSVDGTEQTRKLTVVR
jgi:hypothetical protein